ncbi:uncharacterized protein BO95DRAFT_245184 [Aspergillus brunneoviolaceus CBS 621.78]|uniref:Uncharacterized protein n=1 Tax=Aspergillus brunneoviolaceus CBS 621.78 TaxID=1450534 RepID=A0ACD1GKJ9_9EURO|nr:hypothetical protein BO95DRAFT_245184 [Aspergillus brunneoviolaceus CBS 621.78]RAH49796.1 hypothetical protein BO95DRAFT_245184 [Aspergillus brunneoviolaceus CBS 621.78]
MRMQDYFAKGYLDPIQAIKNYSIPSHPVDITLWESSTFGFRFSVFSFQFSVVLRGDRPLGPRLDGLTGKYLSLRNGALCDTGSHTDTDTDTDTDGCDTLWDGDGFSGAGGGGAGEGASSCLSWFFVGQVHCTWVMDKMLNASSTCLCQWDFFLFCFSLVSLILVRWFVAGLCSLSCSWARMLLLRRGEGESDGGVG